MSGPERSVLIRTGLSYGGDEKLDEAVEGIFSLCEAARRLGPGSKTVLKPNLLGKYTPEQAVTTDPAVLSAVIRALHRRGVKEILLADSSAGLASPAIMKGIYEASGLAGVCRQNSVGLWLGSGTGSAAADGELVREFTLIEPVIHPDFLIDLAKLKTHEMMGMTCAVKNLFGCIPGIQKAEMHLRFPDRRRFGTMLCDLSTAVRPDLVIVDAVAAMHGDGPSGGKVIRPGILFGGCDPWQTDLAAAALIGARPAQIPYLAAGQRRGFCGEAFDPADLAPGSDGIRQIPGWTMPVSYTASGSPAGLFSPHPVVRRSACVGCGKCAEICPGKAIRIQSGKASIRADRCIRCFCCHEVCPQRAVRVARFRLIRLKTKGGERPV
jgi:uncharacterized protein (DUF362 family)/ferredoxin